MQLEQIVEVHCTILPTYIKPPLSDVRPARVLEPIGRRKPGILDYVIQNINLAPQCNIHLSRLNRWVGAPSARDTVAYFVGCGTARQNAHKCHRPKGADNLNLKHLLPPRYAIARMHIGFSRTARCCGLTCDHRDSPGTQ